MKRRLASLGSTLGSYPVTTSIAALAIASMAIPGLTECFETDFALMRDGQWWRAITGHWTHYDISHVFWDLLMFVVLSAACERRCSRGYLPWMIASLATITWVVGWSCPEITHYRGLSGIDTGLFVWVAGDFVRSSLGRKERWRGLGGVVAIVGLVGKLIYEARTGQTLFVDSSTFTPLVQSHLAGAAIGLVTSLGFAAGSVLPASRFRPGSAAATSVVVDREPSRPSPTFLEGPDNHSDRQATTS